MILNETQIAIRDTVREFAQDRIAPSSARFERQGGYDAWVFESVAELGLLGMIAPEEFGGADSDHVSYALALIDQIYEGTSDIQRMVIARAL